MGKIDDLKEQIKKEDEMLDQMEENVKKELKDYSKAALAKDIEFNDDKPFVQKLVLVFVGLTYFLVGYALYFLIKDDKKKQWQASYLIKASTVGLVLEIAVFIFDVIAAKMLV